MSVRGSTGQIKQFSKFIVTKCNTFNSEILVCSSGTVLVLLPSTFPSHTTRGLENCCDYLIHSKMTYKGISDRSLVRVSELLLLLREALEATAS